MHALVKNYADWILKPTLFATRAAIGTADTPAAPIKGLIGDLLNLFITLAINTPQAVPIQNAIAPNAKIPNVSALRKASALNFEPTASPQKDSDNIN